MTTPIDKPTDVTTQEKLRAPDKHIITSDSELNTGEELSTGDTATTDDNAAGTNGQESDTGNDNKQEPHKKRHARQRFQKLTANLSASKRENQANQQRIKDLEAELEAKPRATKPKAAAEPQLEDFDSPKDYGKAYANWESDNAESKPTKPDTPKPKAEPAQPAPADGEVEAFITRGKEKLGDEFLEAMSEDPSEPTPINQLMGEYIFASDFGPEIFVHLTNNKDNARKIYDSKAPIATKALEALLAKAKAGELDVGDGDLQFDDDSEDETDEELAAATTKNPTAKEPSGTKAPKPPSSTKDGGDAGLKPDPETESMDDYASRRKKYEMRRRGYPV